MQDYGLVSIITPTWGCASYIEETIRSVQAQTYQNWELLIQDDCSIDHTAAVVTPYAEADPRIKYECNERNSGAAITRNNAIRRAAGRWIAFLDSDDLWRPEKLEHQLAFMHDGGYAFSYHEYSEMSDAGEDTGVRVSGKKRVNKFDMFSCCWPGCLTVVYDAESIGLVQIRDVRKDNDTAIWLKVVRKADCYLLKEDLARYRRRDGSITPSSVKDRILWHYKLFRQAELMNPFAAAFWMCMNVAGNSIKKIFYVKRPR